MEDDVIRQPKGMAELLKDFGKSAKRKTPHEKSAIVDEILLVVGNHKIYNYKYWLRKIGSRSYPEMMGILKEVKNANPKYNKGGMLTNKLSNKKKK